MPLFLHAYVTSLGVTHIQKAGVLDSPKGANLAALPGCSTHICLASPAALINTSQRLPHESSSTHQCPVGLGWTFPTRWDLSQCVTHCAALEIEKNADAKKPAQGGRFDVERKSPHKAG